MDFLLIVAGIIAPIVAVALIVNYYERRKRNQYDINLSVPHPEKCKDADFFKYVAQEDKDVLEAVYKEFRKRKDFLKPEYKEAIKKRLQGNDNIDVIYQQMEEDDIDVEHIVERPVAKKTKSYKRNISGEVLKPDFDNAINNTNPFYKKKVVLTGFEYDEKVLIAEELKKLGADLDLGIGKKTDFLILGKGEPGPSKLKKMKQLMKERKDAKIITFEEYINLKWENQSQP